MKTWTLDDLFAKTVRVAPPPGVHGDCMIWTGYGYRYGRIRRFENRKRKWYPVHKVVNELVEGTPVPGGILVCHHCDRGLCINPDHLFRGTQSDNMWDASFKGRINQPKTPEHSERVAAALRGNPHTDERRKNNSIGQIAARRARELGYEPHRRKRWEQ